MTQARTRYKRGRLIRWTLVAAALSSWPLSPSGGVPVEVLHRSHSPKCCVQQLPAVITVSVFRPVICTVALYRRYRSNKEIASYPCPCVPKRRAYSTAPERDAKIAADAAATSDHASTTHPRKRALAAVKGAPVRPRASNRKSDPPRYGSRAGSKAIPTE